MSASPTWLVTGASGWLGSRLVEALSRGLPEVPTPSIGGRGTVRCLVLPGQDLGPLQRLGHDIEIAVGDIRSPADCARFLDDASNSVLFHTAGIIHPARVSQFYDINVHGTENLLDAAAKARIKRAVVISSNSPCGCNPHPDHLFDESSPYRPYMNYGRSKMLMEQVVHRYQRERMLETVLLRPPWFYGPNQPARQTLFFRMIREGKAPIVGSGENLRSMAYVDNICAAALLAATADCANGQTYWIADQRPYSMNEIIDTVERLMESAFALRCARKRLRLPSAASSVAFAADKLLQGMGVYQQMVHVLSEMNKTIACSIAKAEDELKYRPAVALEEGMRRSLKWCLEHGRNL